MKKILISTAIAFCLPTIAAADDVAVDWSGFYAGASLTHAMGDVRAVPGASALLESNTTGGIFAGYNWQKGNIVTSLEAAYTPNKQTAVGFPNSHQMDLIDVKARFGVTRGKSLFYGTLGATQSIFDDNTNIFNQKGINMGIGFEYAVSDHIIIGGEYLKRKIKGELGGSVIHSNIDTASFRLSYKF